ncbi:hypothetical protein BT69DRAFT_1349379 [Atractiella rhizophila]|nr:hypothetical protein BT69DRAFT_1349379 [Atractiella rhizophila]
MDLPLVSSSLLHFTTNTASVGSLLWLLSSYPSPSTVSSAQDGGGSEGGVPIALLFGATTLAAWAFSRQKDVYMAVEQKAEGVLGLVSGFLAGIGAVLSLWSLGSSSEGNAAILAVEPPLLLLLSLVHSLPLPTSLSRLSLLAISLLILQIPSSLSQEAFKVFFSNVGMRVVGFGLVWWSKADGLRGRSAVTAACTAFLLSLSFERASLHGFIVRLSLHDGVLMGTYVLSSLASRVTYISLSDLGYSQLLPPLSSLSTLVILTYLRLSSSFLASVAGFAIGSFTIYTLTVLSFTRSSHPFTQSQISSRLRSVGMGGRGHQGTSSQSSSVELFAPIPAQGQGQGQGQGHMRNRSKDSMSYTVDASGWNEESDGNTPVSAFAFSTNTSPASQGMAMMTRSRSAGSIASSHSPDPISKQRIIFQALWSLVYLFLLVLPHAPHLRDRLPIASVLDPWNASLALSPNDSVKPIQMRGTNLTELLINIPTVGTHALWLTVADTLYASHATSHLSMFLSNLNSEHASGRGREELLVLCLDEGCLEQCGKMGVWAFLQDYEEVAKDKEEQMRRAVRAKISGLVEVAEDWRVVFADGDFFLKRDPWDIMEDDEGKWDLQIQNEGHRRWVNIGFFSHPPSPLSKSLWVEVLRRLDADGGWDQDHVNDVLKSEAGREVEGGNEAEQAMEFTGRNGMRVRVLEPRYFWGGHMGWFVWEEGVGLHMTCCETTFLKFFIAATYGYWQDVGSYYSSPPRILSIASLSGTPAEIQSTVQLLVAAALQSDRALLLPLFADVLAPISPEDGTDDANPVLSALTVINGDGKEGRGVRLHRRFIWSVIDLERLSLSRPTLALLEPNYLHHTTANLSDLRPADMDLRPLWLWSYLENRLEEETFKERRHVRIVTDEGPAGRWSRYGQWEIPLEWRTEVEMCQEVEKVSGCKELCRRRKEEL